MTLLFNSKHFKARHFLAKHFRLEEEEADVLLIGGEDHVDSTRLWEKYYKDLKKKEAAKKQNIRKVKAKAKTVKRKIKTKEKESKNSVDLELRAEFLALQIADLEAEIASIVQQRIDAKNQLDEMLMVLRVVIDMMF